MQIPQMFLQQMNDGKFHTKKLKFIEHFPSFGSDKNILLRPAIETFESILIVISDFQTESFVMLPQIV